MSGGDFFKVNVRGGKPSEVYGKLYGRKVSKKFLSLLDKQFELAKRWMAEETTVICPKGHIIEAYLNFIPDEFGFHRLLWCQECRDYLLPSNCKEYVGELPPNKLGGFLLHRPDSIPVHPEPQTPSGLFSASVQEGGLRRS